MNKKIVDISMREITKTFGYDKDGVHLKKCEICETDFYESNDLNYLVANGSAKCPDCSKIFELQTVLESYSNKIKNIEFNDQIFNNNMIKQNEINIGPVNIQSYSLDEFEKEIIVEGRTKKVQELIDRIVKGREFLYMELEPKIHLLKSIYIDKDRFWNDGGNLKYHVSEVTIQYIVIKLNEFLSANKNSSKISINKIVNIIKNSQKAIFDEQKIIKIKKYKKSGDFQKNIYPRFNISEYLSRLDGVLENYRAIINAFDDYRDTQFAHIDDLKNPNSKSQLTYKNIVKIFNSLKIIYDGFLFSVAPDLFNHMYVNHNVWYSHLNRISESYSKK